MSFSYNNKKAKLTSKQIWKHSPLTVPRTRSPKKKGRKIIKFHKEDKISFGGSISLHTRKPPRSSQFHYKPISETVPPTSCKKTKHPPIFNHFKSQNKYPHTSNETKKRKEKRTDKSRTNLLQIPLLRFTKRLISLSYCHQMTKKTDKSKVGCFIDGFSERVNKNLKILSLEKACPLRKRIAVK